MEVMTKQCANCKTLNPMAAKRCMECGTEFPPLAPETPEQKRIRELEEELAAAKAAPNTTTVITQHPAPQPTSPPAQTPTPSAEHVAEKVEEKQEQGFLDTFLFGAFSPNRRNKAKKGNDHGHGGH